jgi:hypothetical protein
MHAHRIRITIPESHEVTVRLPSDVPPGEAVLIVLTESPPAAGSSEPFKTWLESWIRALPPSPAIPLDALRRENLYE